MVAKSLTSVIVGRPFSFNLQSFALMSVTPVWSNFEIADMDFWRAPAYTAYVDYLEASGGFYYEVCTSSLPPARRNPSDTRCVSGGVMHQSIASGLPCSRTRTKSTSSTRSDTNTHLTSTAHERGSRGRTADVTAIPVTASVSFMIPSSRLATNRASHHQTMTDIHV